MVKQLQQYVDSHDGAVTSSPLRFAQAGVMKEKLEGPINQLKAVVDNYNGIATGSTLLYARAGTLLEKLEEMKSKL